MTCTCGSCQASAAERWSALRKATWRFLKIFVLGVITQGGISLVEFDLVRRASSV